MSKKLLVMAGGTGGHVFPAIAVAQTLQKEGWEICWLGTKDRMEAQLVPKHGIPIRFIQISGLRGKGIKALLGAPFAILRAVLQARKIIQEYKPNAVLGMGGYVSGPGGIAAKLCGVPVILHEQNAVAGLTNEWLAKIATRVLQAFPTAFKDAEVVGNPVRQDLFEMPSPQARFSERSGKLRVLVVGGSQGARVLNQTIPQVVAQQVETLTITYKEEITKERNRADFWLAECNKQERIYKGLLTKSKNREVDLKQELLQRDNIIATMKAGLTDFLRGFTIICQNAINAVIDFAHDTKLQHFTFPQATAINEYLSKESSDRRNGATILALLTRPFLNLFEHQKGKVEIENVANNFDWYKEKQRWKQQEEVRDWPRFRR